MVEQKRIIINEPTLRYEITRVIGGRAPKTEISLKLSGDVNRIAEDISQRKIQPLFSAIKDVLKQAFVDAQEALQDAED